MVRDGNDFHFIFEQRYYTPLQPAFYPFPFHQMMTATPDMEMMNDQETLQGILDANAVQEPAPGILVFVLQVQSVKM